MNLLSWYGNFFYVQGFIVFLDILCTIVVIIVIITNIVTVIVIVTVFVVLFFPFNIRRSNEKFMSSAFNLFLLVNGELLQFISIQSIFQKIYSSNDFCSNLVLITAA